MKLKDMVDSLGNVATCIDKRSIEVKQIEIEHRHSPLQRCGGVILMYTVPMHKRKSTLVTVKPYHAWFLTCRDSECDLL